MTAKVSQICSSYVVMAIYNQNGKFLSNYNVPYSNIKQTNISVGQEYNVVDSEGTLTFWLK